jgi:hypothetical protein
MAQVAGKKATFVGLTEGSRSEEWSEPQEITAGTAVILEALLAFDRA